MVDFLIKVGEFFLAQGMIGIGYGASLALNYFLLKIVFKLLDEMKNTNCKIKGE